jgi:hypothetical protein
MLTTNPRVIGGGCRKSHSVTSSGFMLSGRVCASERRDGEGTFARHRVGEFASLCAVSGDLTRVKLVAERGVCALTKFIRESNDRQRHFSREAMVAVVRNPPRPRKLIHQPVVVAPRAIFELVETRYWVAAVGGH